MESSHLPIQICEAIMADLVEFTHEILYLATIAVWQDTLCACALTCRAWRAPAQRLLWAFPHVLDGARLARFTAAIRTTAASQSLTTLLLADNIYNEKAYCHDTACELFALTFPRLQELHYHDIRFEHGPSLRLLRTRLPFFASVTVLDLRRGIYRSLRALLDMVWGCPNLSTLRITDSEFYPGSPSAKRNAQLSAACAHVRGCRSLTRLTLDIDTLQAACALAPPGLCGSVFGTAITELQYTQVYWDGTTLFSTFLKGAFPALRSVHVWSCKIPILSWLHALAAGRPVPGALKRIVLDREHGLDWEDGDSDRCWGEHMGSSEEMARNSQQLPSDFVSGLDELTVRLYLCPDPGTCAAHIASDILPQMHDVLRFEHVLRYGEWAEYTLPPQ